jgi:hypothetical protein
MSQSSTIPSPTVTEVAAELEVDPATVRNWLPSGRGRCPPLGGEPFALRRDLVERIRQAFAADEAGRLVDPDGRAWVKRSRLLESLREIRPTFSQPTLSGWLSPGTCPLLKGRRGIAHRRLQLGRGGAAEGWCLEEDVEAVLAAFRRAARGEYGDPADPIVTASALPERLGVPTGTVKDWLRQGLLDWVPIRRWQGKIGGLPERGVRLSQAEEVKAARWPEYTGEFDGGNRLSLTNAATLLGWQRQRIEKLLYRCLDEAACRRDPRLARWRGLLDPEERETPRGLRGHPRPLTVLAAGVRAIKDEWRDALRSRPPRNWKAHDEILAHFGVRDLFLGNNVLKELRQYSRLAGQYVSDKERRRNSLRRTWLYNVPELARRLAGRPFADLADPVQRRAILGDPSEAAPKKRRGRKRSPQTAALYEFCYRELAARIRKRSAIRKLAQERFPNLHMDDPDVTIYARRHAIAAGKPWPV